MELAPLIDDFGPQNADTERTSSTVAIPHIVAWNLTARCNLACSHCYISAGPWVKTDQDITTCR